MNESEILNLKFKIDPNESIQNENNEFKFKDLLDLYLKSFEKVNHKIYRKIVKKIRRKHSRQTKAVFRKKFDRVESRPQIECDSTNTVDEIKNSDKEYQLWLEREKFAQIEHKAKIEKQQRDLKRKQCLEKSKESKINEEEIVNKKNHTYDFSCHEKSPSSNKTFLNDAPTHNPILLTNFSEFEDERKPCKFFIRTGVCKYGNMCLNSHTNKRNSNRSFKTLIFPGMYTNMLLGYEVLQFNLDSDEALEYEESDILEHYRIFYEDVYSEMKKFGNIVQFLVCSNYEPHLRGNVYVQYENEHEALDAYRNLNGRFYAGKKIYCYFTHVQNWRDAICGLFLKKKCIKGQKCNFLHVFENHGKLLDLSDYQKKINRITESSNSISCLTNKNNKNKNDWNSDDDELRNSNFKWEDDTNEGNYFKRRRDSSKENLKSSKKIIKSDKLSKKDEHKSKSKKRHKKKKKHKHSRDHVSYETKRLQR